MSVQKFYEQYPYPHPYQELLQKDKVLSTPGLEFNKYKNILVLGCGTQEAIYTAKNNPNAIVIGVDFSKTSIQIAKKLQRKLKINNLYLFTDDLLNYLNNSYSKYDLILCNGVLHHIEYGVKNIINKIYEYLEINGIFFGMVYQNCEERKNIQELNSVIKSIPNITPEQVEYYLFSSSHLNVKNWYLKHVKHRQEIADTWMHPYFKLYTEEEVYNLLNQFRNSVVVNNNHNWIFKAEK